LFLDHDPTVALEAVTKQYSDAKVLAGNGVPSVTALSGTLYLRRDGASGSRVYVNQNGATTWLAIPGV
jgi:hypothetical protein